MKALRVIIGLTLVFIVSTINGISGIGYVVGGEFEISLQAAGDNETKDDSRWKTQEDDAESYKSPRDGLATLSLLLDSKFGRFGLLLQMLCLLQFIGGLIVVFRSSTRVTAFIFLILVALAGIVVEVMGAYYSSTWGVTNVVGIVVSIMLISIAFHMHKATDRKNKLQDAV